jgi:shikimate kinase
MSGGHLVLVGLMGAGKTTVGAEVAQRLDRPFVDTDDLVEVATGRTVAEIFATEGEGAFRARERQAVADACAAPAPMVIACGGGAILDPESRRRLCTGGFVVWLQAPPAVLADRLAASDARPLLAGRMPVATLERLAHVREAAYAATADAEVETEGRTVAQVADAVLAAMPAPGDA